MPSLNENAAQVVCGECGAALSDQEIEDGFTLCYGCWHWHMDYAELCDVDA
jgi:hypothetical protein